jgi:membrane associated rhomboid family serine protease
VVFPLYDDNPFTLPRPPYVTWTLIAINVAVFLWTVGLPEARQIEVATFYGVTPALVTQSIVHLHVGYADLGLLTGMFLHAGWGHILGNMIYLWVFGDDIEEAFGPLRFLAFYLLTGVASALAFVIVDPNGVMPLIGASGAISGVLAGYLMLRPCAKVLVFVLRVVVRLRAYWVIGAWAVLQILSLMSQPDDGVAYIAHVGGLTAGIALFLGLRPAGLKLFDCPDREESPALVT